MVINSKLNSDQYFYVMNPRTGTWSYSFLFEVEHEHIPYNNRPDEAKDLTGISVVRHPFDKFVSGINNLYYSLSITEEKIYNFLESEDVFYDIIYSSLNKNCIPKSVTLQDTTNLLGSWAHFRTQVEYAYHPNVRIFRYENIEEFNIWIKNVLGYDIELLPKYNQSKKYDTIPTIDTTTTKFKELVEYLFYDDFKVFGYEL